jgi:hypothetical protein
MSGKSGFHAIPETHFYNFAPEIRHSVTFDPFLTIQPTFEASDLKPSDPLLAQPDPINIAKQPPFITLPA